MADELHDNWVRVPLTWCGQTRPVGDDLVWTCMGCSNPIGCAKDQRCQRATDDDFARVTGGRV